MKNEIAHPKVILDGKQAEEELDKLTQKAKKLKEALHEAASAGDTQAEKRLQQQLRATNTELRNMKKEAFDVNNVLKNINGASFNELSQAVRKATNDLRKMKQTDTGFADQEKRVISLKTKIAQLSNEQKANTPFWGRMADGANKYYNVLLGGIAALAGFVFSIRQVIQTFNDFEERLDNLSALTGQSGENLEWLGNKAKELSTSMLEGGIRITKSAGDIVDAFTKMGSARPELLKNKEDLVQVTEKALILAQASKIEMLPAIEAVAAAMNQFNLGASESSRIINTMGAGSLAGSSEVANLTESLSTCGTVAANSNLSLEQTVAVLETLAERQLKGEEAGTQFKTTLISLKAAGLGYTSGVFNMRDAIIELKARIDAKNTAMEKDNALIEVFGKRNITVGTILTESIGRYDYFTKAVTGTNVAFQQAAINSTSNAARLAQASNRLNVMSIELGQKLAPALTVSTSGLAYFVKGMSIAIDFLVRTKGVIVPLIASVVAYTIVTKLATIWETRNNAEKGIGLVLTKAKVLWHGLERGALLLSAAAQALFTGNLIRATAAMRLFAASTMLNPIGLFIGILAAAIVALAMYSRGLTAAQQAQKAVNDVNIEAQKAMVEEKLKVEQLLKTAKNEKLSKETRLKAIRDLNEISPEYLGNLTLEKINTDEAKKATDNYIESIKKKAKATAGFQKLVEIEKELIDLQNGKGAESTFWQNTWNMATSAGNAAVYAGKLTITALNNIDEKTKALMLTKKKLTEQMDAENKTSDDPGAGSKPGGSDKKNAEDLIKLKEKELQTINDEIAATPAEIASRNKRAEALQNEINKLKELGTSKGAKSKAKKDKEDAEAAIKVLDNAQNDIMAKLVIMYEQQGWTDARFKIQQLIAEQAYLEEKKKLLEKYGQSTIQIEAQISQTKIDSQKELNAAIAEMEKENQANQDEAQKDDDARLTAEIDATNKALDNIKEHKDAEKKLLEDRARNYQMISETIVSSLSDMISGSLDEYESYGEALVLMALQVLKQMAPIWAATIVGGSLATPDSIMTGGIAGIAKFTALLAIMEGFIGLAENSVKKGITRKRDAASAGKSSGYASGGYTGPGDKYEIAGVVHRKEYVIPAEGMENTDIQKLVDPIEIARRSGTLRTINLPAIIRAISARNTGYSSGGSVGISSGSQSSSPVIVSSSSGVTDETAKKFTAAVDRLLTWNPAVSVETYERKRENWKKTTSGGLK